MPVSVVFLHAHPDDEALLTGGTIARLAAQGHRVILVTATDGGAGLTAASFASPRTLTAQRSLELDRSASALGAARVVRLDYADSGLDGHGTASTPGFARATSTPFADVPVDLAARRVAAVLTQEDAQVMVGYDSAGGYGHPDHVQVHHVARRAAELASTPLLLEATMPREPYARATRALYSLHRVVPALNAIDVDSWATCYTPKADITHRIDVRPYLSAKRAALAAHASQASADSGPRTINALLRLPMPVLARLLGHEWFIGPRSTVTRYQTDPLATITIGDSR